MTSPTLETPRLLLRPFVHSDREALVALLSDKEAMGHMHYKSWNDEQCQGWVDTALEIAEQSNPDGIAWAIERKDTGEVIGWFGISNPIDPANTYNVSFEYALVRALWNKGYMTEVLRGIFSYEFDTLGVPQLRANCCAPNSGSARAMEKAGMHLEKSDYSADFEGNWCHRHHFRITRAEYETQRQLRSL